MGTTNILDMNNRISALEKDVTSVEDAVEAVVGRLVNHHLSGINTGLQVSKNWREMTIGFSPYPTAGTRQLFTQNIKRDTFDDFVDGVNFIMAEVYKDDTDATHPSRCQVKIEKNSGGVLVTPIICTWTGIDLLASAKIFVDYSE